MNISRLLFEISNNFLVHKVQITHTYAKSSYSSSFVQHQEEPTYSPVIPPSVERTRRLFPRTLLWPLTSPANRRCSQPASRAGAWFSGVKAEHAASFPDCRCTLLSLSLSLYVATSPFAQCTSFPIPTTWKQPYTRWGHWRFTMRTN